MVDGLIWSVGLEIDDAEARRLTDSSVAFYMLEATEGHQLRFSSPVRAKGEKLENLRLEVSAGSALDAEERALGIVYRARRASGLPDKVVPVAGVFLQGSLEEGENFLDQAEELLEDESFSLAIVAAEIHLEARVKAILETAVRMTVPDLEEVLSQHRYNFRIQHQAGRKMLEHFLGLNVTRLPEWKDYKDHCDRRNAVVHSGESFGEEEAAESIYVVRRIWLRLSEAIRAAEETLSFSPTASADEGPSLRQLG